MNRYIGFGFIASALASAYMFFRAASNGFSSEIGLCLARGGESCFSTSNPVWTAATLKWLAPSILLLSVFGFFTVRLLGRTNYGWVAGLIFVIVIISLALSQEIKEKSGWMAPFNISNFRALF